MSNCCNSGWSSDSRWHSAQSNHFRPGGGNQANASGQADQVRGEASQHGDLMETCAFRTCLLGRHNQQLVAMVGEMTYHMVWA